MRQTFLFLTAAFAVAPAPAQVPCGPQCVCVTETEKVTKTVYGCTIDESCSPRWRLFDWLLGRGPTRGECGALRKKRVLVKFSQTHEHPETKCVPAADAAKTKP